MVERIPPEFICYTTKIKPDGAKGDEGISVILRLEGIEASNEQAQAMKEIQERLSAEINGIMGW